MKNYYTYKGITIWRNLSPCYALRYTASGGLAADTLQGMKQLITETLKNERK